MKKPNYKNWVPFEMLLGLYGSVGILSLFSGLYVAHCRKANKGISFALLLVLTMPILVLAALGCRLTWMYRAFSYKGKKRISAYILDYVAAHVSIPDGGTVLDVGCGSGALTIMLAKLYPEATAVGLDCWSGGYRSYNQKLCADNARAENADNVMFIEGDAQHLPFADEQFDAVASNYVYHNIKKADKQAVVRETLRTLKKGGSFAIHDIMHPSAYGDVSDFASALHREGFAEVHLVDTTEHLLENKWQARLLMLNHSYLLYGKK